MATSGKNEDTVELTREELAALREQPCSDCGAEPPFRGNYGCDIHRIIPGSEGGKYTADNVTPLCRPCHMKRHPEVVALASGARRSRIGQRRSVEAQVERRASEGKTEAEQERDRVLRDGFMSLPAERRTEIAKKAQAARSKESLRQSGIRVHEVHPNLASENQKKGLASRLERQRREGLTDAEYKNIVQAGRQSCKNMTPELREAKRRAGRKGGAATVQKRLDAGLTSYGLTPEEQAEVSRRAGKKGAKTLHERYPNLSSETAKKLHRDRPELAATMGRKGAHVRWHVNRGIVSPDCELCHD